jgi:hypothetical protein
MVGAKQLRTLGLSWFRPGPYVQQGCARGTILLRTGVPVVGRLQARWERRRSLQVPSGVIGVSANCRRREGRDHAIYRYLLSRIWCRVSCGEGDHLPFIDQGEGDVQACRTARLRAEVWHIVPWR